MGGSVKFVVQRVGLALWLIGHLMGTGFLHGLASKSAIIGTVKDEGGSMIPNVTVRVTNLETSIGHTAITDNNGNFSIRELNPGKYAVEAQLVGFQKFTREDIILSAESEFILAIKLSVWSSAERPSHLGRSIERFGVKIQRKAQSETERYLISKAEQLPCPNRKWWHKDADGVRIPVCLNATVLNYFTNLIERHKKDQRPIKKRKIQKAEVFYEASLVTQGDSNGWTVELRLEYSHSCGNLCGITFSKVRTVIFDKNQNVVKVIGDEKEPLLIVS